MALTLRLLGQASKSAAVLEAVTPKRSGLGSKTPRTPKTPKTPGAPFFGSGGFFSESDRPFEPKTPVASLGRACGAGAPDLLRGHVTANDQQPNQTTGASCLRAQGLVGGAYPVMLGRHFAAGKQEHQQRQPSKDQPDFGGLSSAIAARDALRARRVRIQERHASPESHPWQPVYPMLLGHTAASTPVQAPLAADEEPAAAARRAYLEKMERASSRFVRFQI